MPLSPTNIDNASTELGSVKRVHVLAVGAWQEREFCAATNSIEEASTWQTAESIQKACHSLEAEEVLPELILIAHSLPRELSQKQIDKLQALAPLSRIVVVAGSWCEGGLRSGVQLTGVIRLYWHEFSLWWRLAHLRVKAGLCPHWSLPLDNPQAGRSMESEHADWPSLPEPVAVCAKDYSVYETLTAALKPFGITTRWMPPTQNVELHDRFLGGIWDGGQLDEVELQRLKEFCRQIDSKVIALVDYPRVEHVALAQEVGATVLGKPYIVDELVELLVSTKL